MRLLEDSAASEWCDERGVDVSGQDIVRRLTFAKELGRVRFSAIGSLAKMVLMARFLINGLDHERAESSFEGGLLWLSRWDIGSQAIEAPGIYLARCLWTAAADRPILAYGQLFEEGDFVAAQAALALPILFGWDAHYVPASGDYVAEISHEGFVSVFSAATESGRLELLCTTAGLDLLPVTAPS